MILPKCAARVDLPDAPGPKMSTHASSLLLLFSPHENGFLLLKSSACALLIGIVSPGLLHIDGRSDQGGHNPGRCTRTSEVFYR